MKLGNYQYIASDFDANIDVKFILNDRLLMAPLNDSPI